VSGPFNDLDPDQSPAAPAEAGTADRDHATTPAPPPRVIKAALRDEPGVVTALVRGATKRCPRCGSGALFKGWFTIRDRCPGCGLRLEREEGGFLGAMVLSYLVTEGILLALLIAWLIVDLPDLYVGALTVASIAVAGMIPRAVLAVLEDDLGERRLLRVPHEPRLHLARGRRPRKRQWRQAVGTVGNHQSNP